jgi:hypothetical protein
MALAPLPTLFQDAFPTYAQTHRLPTHVRRAARHDTVPDGGPSAAMGKLALTATSPVSGTTRAATGHVRRARLSRPSVGWPSNARGCWPVTMPM